MYRTESVETFLTQLAARSPTPGGGAASALSGAAGAAQAAMCAAFTTRKERFKAVEAEALRHQARFDALREEFLELMDRDSQAYLALVAARKQARAQAGTDADRGGPGGPRSQAVAQAKAEQAHAAVAAASEQAAQAPAAVLAKAHEGLQLVQSLARICNPNLIADVAVAAWLLLAAARGAALQARANLKDLPEAVARDAGVRAQLRACRTLATAIQQAVVQALGIPDDD